VARFTPRPIAMTDRKPISDTELIATAARARTSAHSPYSHFPVGAAVLTATGRVFAGANVENASYGLTVCAERVAIWKAVTEGETEIVAIAVVSDGGASPCGACRQVMVEFASPAMGLVGIRVLVADLDGHSVTYTLEDLLPQAFTPGNLAEHAGGVGDRSTDGDNRVG
jgi:homotetrameric cytidine deaminase